MAHESMLVQTGNRNNHPATERRAWVRPRSEQGISCQQGEPIYTWSASIQEVSHSAITLTLRRQFELGAVLNIERAPKNNGPRCAVVRVVHAAQQLNARWILNCAFAYPLSEDDLQNFLEE
jgi:hypothetical protein